MTIKLRWRKDDVLEDVLERRAVEFDVITMPFSKIDLKTSQVNGARLGVALLEDTIDLCTHGFMNGDKMPMPVGHKTPTGVVLLGGNQRCESLNRIISDGDLPKNIEIPVYIVNTTDKLLLELIARTANNTHGSGPSREERLQHAIHCVRRLGMAIREAAREFAVSESSVGQSIRAEEVRNRLLKAGVRAEHVPLTALDPLHKLDYDESAQLKIGTLVAHHRPTAERVKQLVGVVSKQSSGQGRTAAIKEFEKECASIAHSANGHAKKGESSLVPARPRKDKLFSMLGRLVNFLESENDGNAFTSLQELQVSAEPDITRATELLKKLRYRVGVLLK